MKFTPQNILFKYMEITVCSIWLWWCQKETHCLKTWEVIKGSLLVNKLLKKYNEVQKNDINCEYVTRKRIQYAFLTIGIQNIVTHFLNKMIK